MITLWRYCLYIAFSMNLMQFTYSLHKYTLVIHRKWGFQSLKVLRRMTKTNDDFIITNSTELVVDSFHLFSKKRYQDFWSDNEVLALYELKTKGLSWEAIGIQLNRSASSCVQKFRYAIMKDLKLCNDNEEAKIYDLILTHGENWNIIGKYSNKQPGLCKLVYMKFLQQLKTSPWDPEEVL